VEAHEKGDCLVMANIFEPNPEEFQDWKSWLGDRPAGVRAVAEKLPPWKLYRSRTTGRRVTVISYDEDVGGSMTLRVRVGGEYNLVVAEREVFGVASDDLKECDLPDPSEVVGVAVLPLSTNR
jgi:hypothetical protein